MRRTRAGSDAHFLGPMLVVIALASILLALAVQGYFGRKTIAKGSVVAIDGVWLLAWLSATSR